MVFKISEKEVSVKGVEITSLPYAKLFWLVIKTGLTDMDDTRLGGVVANESGLIADDSAPKRLRHSYISVLWSVEEKTIKGE
jgi:hypothetical protein